MRFYVRQNGRWLNNIVIDVGNTHWYTDAYFDNIKGLHVAHTPPGQRTCRSLF